MRSTLVGLDFIVDHPPDQPDSPALGGEDHWQLPSLSLLYFAGLAGPVSEIIRSNRTFKQISFAFGLDLGHDIDSKR